MRTIINEAITSTVLDMIKSGLEVSFTQKELNRIELEVAHVSFGSAEIQRI